VVFFNAGSGSFAYARMGRVDFKSGLMFATATIPGAILGAMTTTILPRRTFDLIFGLLLTAGSVYLIRCPCRVGDDGPLARFTGHYRRHIVERDGTVHDFGYSPLVGISISVVVGFLSSLLGIGGGIIHVPVLSELLGFPVHIATATSHFTLAVMALAGSLVHVANGQLATTLGVIAPLAIGVLVGAQVGARLSSRVHGTWIMRSLAIALGLVSVRILLAAL
jgi:uncharacterized membrane protein YfcA